MSIAPNSKIIIDYENFKPKLSVKKGFSLDTALKCLSVAGHASKGHSTFAGQAYEETSPLDILNAVTNNSQQNSEKIRRNVSKNIDSTRWLLEDLLMITTGDLKKEDSRLYNHSKDTLELRDLKTGKTLFGFNEFSGENYNISDPLTFLRGAYIASKMDAKKTRKETCDHFKKDILGKDELKIAGGTCQVANLSRLRKNNISIKRLAETVVPESEIEKMKNKGIIFDRQILHSHIADKFNPNNLNLYIREELGLGCCDDATLLTIGKLFAHLGPKKSLDAFFGGAVIDTVDTIDKMSAILVTGGADEYLGEYINNKYKAITNEDLVSKEDIYSAVYGGAKNNLGDATFSSSIRRFHELQRFNKRGHHMTAFAAHKLFLTTGEKTSGLKLGFTEFPSEKFYQIIEDRQRRMTSMGLFN